MEAETDDPPAKRPRRAAAAGSAAAAAAAAAAARDLYDEDEDEDEVLFMEIDSDAVADSAENSSDEDASVMLEELTSGSEHEELAPRRQATSRPAKVPNREDETVGQRMKREAGEAAHCQESERQALAAAAMPPANGAPPEAVQTRLLLTALLQSQNYVQEEISEHIICDVCRSDECGDDNPLLVCDFCQGVVHTTCYSMDVADIPEGLWFCDRCSLSGEESKASKCIVCCQTGGVMHQVRTKNERSKHKFCHVSCALVCPELQLEVTNANGWVTIRGQISQQRARLACVHCGKGGSVQCTFSEAMAALVCMPMPVCVFPTPLFSPVYTLLVAL